MANILAPVCINLTLASGLNIYKGSSWSLPITVSNRENLADKPIDLTGLEGICTIKKNAGDDLAVAMPKVTITDAKNGKFLISLTAEETSNFIVDGKTWRDVSKFQYDVCFTDSASGDVYRSLMGEVEVSPSVTDSDDGV